MRRPNESAKVYTDKDRFYIAVIGHRVFYDVPKGWPYEKNQGEKKMKGKGKGGKSKKMPC